jgi:hypothetical protein
MENVIKQSTLSTQLFEEMDRNELYIWLQNHATNLSNYQLREICKDIKRYKESAGVMNQMVSLGVEMGE